MGDLYSDNSEFNLEDFEYLEALAQEGALSSDLDHLEDKLLSVLEQLSRQESPASDTSFKPEMGLLQNGLFSEIAMLPNDSDTPFLARRGGVERHEESENGADGAFRNKAEMCPNINGQQYSYHQFFNTMLPLTIERLSVKIISRGD